MLLQHSINATDRLPVDSADNDQTHPSEIDAPSSSDVTASSVYLSCDEDLVDCSDFLRLAADPCSCAAATIAASRDSHMTQQDRLQVRLPSSPVISTVAVRQQTALSSTELNDASYVQLFDGFSNDEMNPRTSVNMHVVRPQPETRGNQNNNGNVAGHEVGTRRVNAFAMSSVTKDERTSTGGKMCQTKQNASNDAIADQIQRPSTAKQRLSQDPRSTQNGVAKQSQNTSDKKATRQQPQPRPFTAASVVAARNNSNSRRRVLPANTPKKSAANELRNPAPINNSRRETDTARHSSIPVRTTRHQSAVAATDREKRSNAGSATSTPSSVRRNVAKTSRCQQPPPPQTEQRQTQERSKNQNITSTTSRTKSKKSLVERTISEHRSQSTDNCLRSRTRRRRQASSLPPKPSSSSAAATLANCQCVQEFSASQTAVVPPSSPCRRSCRCHNHRDAVLSTDAVCCSSARSASTEATQSSATTTAKPWAKTLRDYGPGDKSPSPVRSRKSTPDSSSTPRRRNMGHGEGAFDSASSAEVLEHELIVSTAMNTKQTTSAASKASIRMTTHSAAAAAAAVLDDGCADSLLGATKSDSTLETARSRLTHGSRASSAIPSSTSLGTMGRRKATPLATGTGNNGRATAAATMLTSVASDRTKQNVRVASASSSRPVPSLVNRSKNYDVGLSRSETGSLGRCGSSGVCRASRKPREETSAKQAVRGGRPAASSSSCAAASASVTAARCDTETPEAGGRRALPSGDLPRFTATSARKQSASISGRQSACAINKHPTAVTPASASQTLGKDKRLLSRNDSSASAASGSSSSNCSSSGRVHHHHGEEAVRRRYANEETIPFVDELQNCVRSDEQPPPSGAQQELFVVDISVSISAASGSGCGTPAASIGHCTIDAHRHCNSNEVPFDFAVQIVNDDLYSDSQIETDQITSLSSTAYSDYRVIAPICDSGISNASVVNQSKKLEDGVCRQTASDVNCTGRCSYHKPSGSNQTEARAMCHARGPANSPKDPQWNGEDVALSHDECAAKSHESVAPIELSHSDMRKDLSRDVDLTSSIQKSDQTSAVRYSRNADQKLAREIPVSYEADKKTVSHVGDTVGYSGDRIVATVRPMCFAPSSPQLVDNVDLRAEVNNSRPIKSAAVFDFSEQEVTDRETNNFVSSIDTIQTFNAMTQIVPPTVFERSRDNLMTSRIACDCSCLTKTATETGNPSGVTMYSMTDETKSSSASNVSVTVGEDRLQSLSSAKVTVGTIVHCPLVQTSQNSIEKSASSSLLTVTYTRSVCGDQSSIFTGDHVTRATTQHPLAANAAVQLIAHCTSVDAVIESSERCSIAPPLLTSSLSYVVGNNSQSEDDTVGPSTSDVIDECVTSPASSRCDSRRSSLVLSASLHAAKQEVDNGNFVADERDDEPGYQSPTSSSPPHSKYPSGFHHSCEASRWKTVNNSSTIETAPLACLDEFDSGIASSQSTTTWQPPNSTDEYQQVVSCSISSSGADGRHVNDRSRIGLSFSLPRDFRRTKSTENANSRTTSRLQLQQRRRLMNDSFRRWSPELSCFRQVGSPEEPIDDDDNDGRSIDRDIAAAETTTSRARARILTRFLPFNTGGSGGGSFKEDRTSSSVRRPRAKACGDANGRRGHSRSPVRGSEKDCDSNTTLATVRYENNDEDVVVELRHYRSLSRQRRGEEREELNHCPPTPPLAVFLSSEDITASVFPLRHAVSEPFGRGSPIKSTGSNGGSGDDRSRVVHRAASGVRFVSGSSTRDGDRRVRERPKSECFGVKLAGKVLSTLQDPWTRDHCKFTTGMRLTIKRNNNELNGGMLGILSTCYLPSLIR